MTKNRTGIALLSALATELMVLLLLVLAFGVAVSQYLSVARDRMRRVEVKVRKRAARRVAA
jgi:hypothetical protein